ncbi:MAG: TonB-dependent receptor [Novosphingobium sp.]|nr:TonB-dependent receptor [Novosphingobium sp.]
MLVVNKLRFDRAASNMDMRALLGGSTAIASLAWPLALVALAHPGIALAQTSEDPVTSSVSPDSAADATEDAGGQSEGRMGDIVVTATKRSENLMDVPIAVSAFTPETLDKIGVVGVQALQIATPAVTFPNTGAFAQPYIRGVGSRLLQNGFDASVASYIDGRYISRQSAIVFDFLDVQRVEVLKGPQGVLFGRNSSAGAIRVITAEPTHQLEGYIKGGYGNYDAWNLGGVINLPLAPTLDLRISGEMAQRDGYAHNIIATGRREWDDKDFKSIRAKLRWEPTDWFDARLTGSWWHQDDNAGNDVVALGRLDLTLGIRLGGVTGIGRKQVATQLTSSNDKEEKALEFATHFDLGMADLTTTTNYSSLENVLTFDADGTSAPVVDALVFETSRMFSQEVQVASAPGGTLEWLVGAYYYRDNSKYDALFDQGTRVSSNGNQKVITESIAGFAQLKWNVSDDFILTAGGRYTKDTKDLDLFASPYHPVFRGSISNPVTPFVLPYQLKDSWSKFTPSVTAEYKIDGTLLYLKYARGFKSGGYNYPAAPALVSPNNIPPVVTPEVLDMYEVGLKGRYFDRKIQLTMSGYYYDYADLQVTSAAASGITSIVTTRNAANAELYGLDVDLNWYATSALTFTGAIAWQHSEYKDFLANAKVYRGLLPGATLGQAGMLDVGFDANGHQLLRAPKFAGFASVNYDFDAGSGTIPVTLAYSYKSSFDFDFVFDPANITTTGATSVLRHPSYSLVNARVGYTPDSELWSLALWVNNLFDKKYFDDVVAAGPGIRGSYGTPRIYGVDLKFKF